MTALTEDPKFKISNIVLSKQSNFTLQEIINEANKIGMKDDDTLIIKSLHQLRDNGIIIQRENHYTVSTKDF